MDFKCWRIISIILKWPRPTSCREMSSFLGFTGVSLQNTQLWQIPWIRLRRHWNLSGQKTSKRNLRSWKQSSQQERSRHIQTLTHHGLVCFEYCWYTVSKIWQSEAFHELLGKEVQQIQEALSIYEGRTTGFSEKYGAMEAYPEVPAPPFSFYSCI